LMPAYRRWFYPHEPAGEDQVAAVQARAMAEIEAAWQQVDAHLAANGPYLLGARRRAADFVLTMLMRCSRNMPGPAGTWPALAAHASRMKALPSFAEVYRREGLTDWTRAAAVAGAYSCERSGRTTASAKRSLAVRAFQSSRV